MSNPVFEQNLQALQGADPKTARKVSSASLEGFPCEWIKTKTSAPSLKIVPGDGAPPVLLHSAYDPMREARRWAEGIQLDEAVNIFILGAGVGYHILAHLQTHERKTRFLFIVEHDPRILRLAMMAVDLRPVILRKGTIWLVGEPPEAIPEIIGDKRTDIVLHNYKVFSHDPSLKCVPAYYHAVQKSLHDAITYDEVNLRTNVENRGRNQFNVFMNLPSIIKGHALKDCASLYQGFPGIVAAAGPSLDNNIEHLRGIQDRAPLIIVDTAQKTMQNHGIEPDFIVTADPTELNFSHFEAIETLGGAFLAFHPEVNRKITNKFMAHPHLLPLFDGESDLLEFLMQAKDRYGTSERAMNVGHIAVHLALHLGCSPIIMAGFDYAFPGKGGTTHVKDAAVSRAILDSQADGTTTIGAKEGRAGQETGKMRFVPGYYGEPVLTTVPFQQYILAIEKTVANTPAQFIDATEGGAAFKGTARMPLQEAMQKCLRQGGAAQRLSQFKARAVRANVDAIIKRLNEGRECLAKGHHGCTLLTERLISWKKRLASGPVSMEEARPMWQAFDKLWVDMVSPPLFDGFLGTSAQYIYYKRQRSESIDEESGTAFLQCMLEKYQFIVSEMSGLLDNFIQTIDLAVAALRSSSAASQTTGNKP